MKIIALLVTLLTLANAEVKPLAWNMPSALQVRGGNIEIGPIDGAFALKLSKAAATAYVAGSASKYIASQSGGKGTQVSAWQL
jgi:hypothetical protein